MDKTKNNIKRKQQKQNVSWPSPSSVDLNIGGSIGFPDRLGVNLKYTEEIPLFGSAAPAAQVYRMNSLFDPNLTGTGTQPELFDQIAAIYSVYGVLAARCKLEFVNNSTTEPSRVVAVFSDANNSGLSVENLTEAKYAKSLTLGIANAGTSVKTILMPWMMTKHIMGQKQVESDANLYALVSANPNDQWYLIIKLTSVDGVTATNVNVKVTIEYQTFFKELNIITES